MVSHIQTLIHRKITFYPTILCHRPAPPCSTPILDKDLLVGFLKLTLDGLDTLLGPGRDAGCKILGADQEAFRIACGRVRVDGNLGARVVGSLVKVETPHELGRCQPHLTLGKMDARADTAASAVDVVVASLIVARSSILGRQLGPALEPGRVELVRVGEPLLIVVQAPDVEHDGSAGREERLLAIAKVDDVVSGQRVREAQRGNRPPPHCLLDNLGDIRKLLVVLPGRGPILANDSVHLGVSGGQHVGVKGQCLDDNQEHRGRGVGATLHEDTTQEVTLVLRERHLLLLVENEVHERLLSLDACLLSKFPTGVDLALPRVVQSLHELADLNRPLDPVTKQGLGEHVQNREHIDGRGSANLHDGGPLLHHVVQVVHVGGFLGVGRSGPDAEDLAHNDRVAHTLGVHHMAGGVGEEVVHQLGGLGVGQYDVVTLALALHEELVDRLAEVAPSRAIVHHQQVVAASDELLGDMGLGTRAVDGALPVDRLTDEAPVSQDGDETGRSDLEGEDALAVDLGPFGEPV